MFTKTKGISVYSALSLLVISAVLGAVYWAQTALNSQESASGLCNISAAVCTVELHGKTISIGFDEPPEVEQQIGLTISGVEYFAIKQVSIKGVNMFMGQIPVVEQSYENGSWQGWTYLGACSEPKMQWEVTVLAERLDSGEIATGRVSFDTSIY